MKYNTFVFDFDLTLADSTIAIVECFKHTMKVHNYEEPTDIAIIKTIGLTLVDAFDILTGINQNPEREQMRVTYVKKADEVMVKKTFLYSDTLEVLARLKSKGCKVAICSTKYRYRIEPSFSHLGDSNPIDLIIGSEDVLNAKPDPTGLLLAIQKLNSTKEQTLYVGDSYIDAQTALNAGVDFGGVLTGTTTQSDFSKYPSAFIGNNLTDLFDRVGI